MSSIRFGALLAIFMVPFLSGIAQTGKAPPASPPTPAPTKNTPQLYNENDSVTKSWTPQPLKCNQLPGAKTAECPSLMDDQIDSFVNSFRKSDFQMLLTTLRGYDKKGATLDWPTKPESCKDLAGTALILHAAFWSTSKSIVALTYSNWRGYRSYWNGKTCVLKQPRSGDNSPLFFKNRRVRLIGIDLFQSAPSADIHLAYKTSTTPAAAQNLQDLGVLIEGVIGASGVAKTVAPKLPLLNGFLTVADFQSTSSPPYTLNVSLSAGKDTGAAQKPQSDVIDCSDVVSKGCSFSRQYSIIEPEYWDVAVGVLTPGVTEAVYSPSSGGAIPKSTITHHTDAYVLIDLFPFGYLAPKQSYVPHVNFGIPLTSQSLHRPYFGVSENVHYGPSERDFH